ncbi:MAG: TraB/GumN family protein [Elusimicrobia bacterium]|nr:TraB/GumN family protein [Elusimicrobiota bacterium]
MKKYICLAFSLIIFTCAYGNKTFSPDLNLVQTYEAADQSYKAEHSNPYMAVFRKDGKTLIYLASKHRYNETNAFADYVFKRYKPQVAVIEIEITGRQFNPYDDEMWEGNHTAVLSAKNKIPVVRADLSLDGKWEKISKSTDKYSYLDFQAFWIIMGMMSPSSPGRSTAVNEVKYNNRCNVNFGPCITADQLNDWTKKNFGVKFDDMDFSDKKYKDITWPVTSPNYITNQIAIVEDKQRDLFMLENITAALNKYKTVFAVFGEGHYVDQRQALENMLGKPEYIWEVPFEVKEEVLVPQ